VCRPQEGGGRHTAAPQRMLTIALAAPVAVMLSAGVAAAGDPAHYAARLKPVPHDHEADGGSRVSGNVQMRLDGRRLTVHLRPPR
jgi:uncharacterized protein YciW